MQNALLWNAQGYAKFEIFEINVDTHLAEPSYLKEDHKKTLLIFTDSFCLAREVTKSVWYWYKYL